ncbi:MAG: hypothetical protein KZQ94_05450 [Candidatus Thiodiazotropha sp. (ex Troendleina suluensis)]|nr:hypothetical protein [Candidatus Thiodiazotropha sp. (ex Troendleina suluensis)]
MPFLQHTNPVARFALLVIIWLPLCLLIWYFLAPTMTWPLAFLIDWILPMLFPRSIAGIDQLGDRLDVVTNLPLPKEVLLQLPPGSEGDLVFTINPLIYSYGLPLYTAMLIAVPGVEEVKWHNLMVGLPWLLVAQVWGVSFDILKTLLFTMGPEITQHMAFTSLSMEIVALGYQLGYLILPPVLPVAIWVVLHRGYLSMLVLNSAENKKMT